MNCPSCGLDNPPYHAECENCSRVLQDETRAEEQRRRWDELSPEVRADFEKDFERFRRTYVEHREWLRRNRVTHGLLGALVTTFFMNLAFLFQIPHGTPVDLASGAAAGILLNRLRGGGLIGAGLFAATALLGLLARAWWIDWDAFWLGWFLPIFCAMLAIPGVGHYLGVRLGSDHVERTL